jgi:hypothetical protein
LSVTAVVVVAGVLLLIVKKYHEPTQLFNFAINVFVQAYPGTEILQKTDGEPSKVPIT